MDPFDELWMRILVGRMAASIDCSLNRDAEVFSYRLKSSVPAWSLVGYRDAHRARRQRGGELLERNSCQGVGTLDIRHYYPSITVDSLSSILSSLRATPGAIDLLCRFLEALEMLGMPSGLPIGPEASGVLGNAGLIGVDRALSQLGHPHVRYSDDSWVFLDDPAMWDDVTSTYEAAAAESALTPNDGKAAFHATSDGSADKALSSGRVDSMLAEAGGFVPPEMAAEELEAQLSSRQPDWTAVRFSLGALAREASTAGLRPLHENPDLFIEAPVQAADYLMAIAKHKKRRQSIDQDWLVEFATAPACGRSVAARLHACRVACHLKVGKSQGVQLEELALSPSHPRNVPLQAWAAAAWGRSSAHKPGRAVANATHVGDLAIRRAFALTIDEGCAVGAKRRRWARHLSAVEPDLLPTLKAMQ